MQAAVAAAVTTPQVPGRRHYHKALFVKIIIAIFNHWLAHEKDFLTAPQVAGAKAC